MLLKNINPMKAIYTLCFLIFHCIATAQHHTYTTSNAHSHNDYEQKQPFWTAYNAGFGSIEADIFLLNDSLFVAHDTTELKQKRSLEDLYLNPLQTCVNNNKGFIFHDSTRQLQLLIDIKTEAKSTLGKLLQVLEKYPVLLHCTTLHFVISGNRPDQSLFISYPSYILFDGELTQKYSEAAQTKIAMLSSNFKNFSSWSGETDLRKEDEMKLVSGIIKAHAAGKTVRFWNAPDNNITWKKLIELNVDFINTDRIEPSANFLISLNNLNQQ